MAHGFDIVAIRTNDKGAVVVRMVLRPQTRRPVVAAARGNGVEMLPCARVTIVAHHPVPIQIDGDVFGTTPVEVDAGSSEVRLIVPGSTTGSGNSQR